MSGCFDSFGCCSRTNRRWSWSGALASCFSSAAANIKYAWNTTNQFIGESYQQGMPLLIAAKAAHIGACVYRANAFFVEVTGHYGCEGSPFQLSCNGSFLPPGKDIYINLSPMNGSAPGLSPTEFVEDYLGSADSDELNLHVILSEVAGFLDVSSVAVVDLILIPLGVVTLVSLWRGLCGALREGKQEVAHGQLEDEEESDLEEGYQTLNEEGFIFNPQMSYSEFVEKFKNARGVIFNARNQQASESMASKIYHYSSLAGFLAAGCAALRLYTTYPGTAQEILKSIGCNALPVPFLSTLFFKNGESCLSSNFTKAIAASFGSEVWFWMLAAYSLTLGTGLTLGSFGQFLSHCSESFQNFLANIGERLEAFWHLSVPELVVKEIQVKLLSGLQVAPLFILPAMINGIADFVHTLETLGCTTNIFEILFGDRSNFGRSPLPVPPLRSLNFWAVNETVLSVPIKQLLPDVSKMCSMPDSVALAAISGSMGFEVVLLGVAVGVIATGSLYTGVRAFLRWYHSAPDERKEGNQNFDYWIERLQSHLKPALKWSGWAFAAGMTLSLASAFPYSLEFAKDPENCSPVAFVLASGFLQNLCSVETMEIYTGIYGPLPWLISTVSAALAFSGKLLFSHAQTLKESIMQQRPREGATVISENGEELTVFPVGQNFAVLPPEDGQDLELATVDTPGTTCRRRNQDLERGSQNASKLISQVGFLAKVRRAVGSSDDEESEAMDPSMSYQ